MFTAPPSLMFSIYSSSIQFIWSRLTCKCVNITLIGSVVTFLTFLGGGIVDALCWWALGGTGNDGVSHYLLLPAGTLPTTYRVRLALDWTWLEWKHVHKYRLISASHTSTWKSEKNERSRRTSHLAPRTNYSLDIFFLPRILITQWRHQPVSTHTCCYAAAIKLLPSCLKGQHRWHSTLWTTRHHPCQY